MGQTETPNSRGVRGRSVMCAASHPARFTRKVWLAGGQPAVVCSGAYCLSSNIWNPPGGKADCGRLGRVISPEGDVMAKTTTDSPFATVEVDLEFAQKSKRTYPRYVPE